PRRPERRPGPEAADGSTVGAMGTWRIDEDRASVRISVDPLPPGLGLTVRGITGTFDIELGEDDRPDLRHPITGPFALDIDRLKVGPEAVSKVARSLLGRGEGVTVEGTIGGTERTHGHDRDEFAFSIDVTVQGTTDTIPGTGVTGVAGPDGLRVEGQTRIDPRGLGINVPLAGRVRSVADWDLWLVAEG
ncbi:MAG: hypothetical protein AAGK32_05765, partial [Actinomycetota bacterium]